MLAQMLDPRVHQERLDEPAFLCDIFEDPPCIGPVAPALARQLAECDKKCIAVLRINPIFDGHEYRSAIVLDFAGRNGCGPMHGRRQINSSTSLQLPAPGQRNHNERSRCRNKVGEWQTAYSCTFSPDRTAERSEEHTSELQSLRHLVCRLLLEN